MPQQPEKATTIQRFDYKAYLETAQNGVNKDLKEIAKQEIEALKKQIEAAALAERQMQLQIEQARNAGNEEEAKRLEQGFNHKVWIKPAIVISAGSLICLASPIAGVAVGVLGLTALGIEFLVKRHRRQQQQEQQQQNDRT